MFHNQSEWRDENVPLKYEKLYKQWLVDNNTKPMKRTKDYLDGRFFEWLVLEYRDKGLYKDEFGENLSLLIRKIMTSRKYIGYSQDLHASMYSEAINMIFRYTIKGFDPEKASAFVFFTSAINNSFLLVLKKHYHQKNLAKEIIRQQRVDAIAYNYDSNEITEIEQELKKMNIDEVEPIETIIEQKINFNKQLKEWFPEIVIGYRMLENENVPKFKRKYFEYGLFLPVGDSGIMIDYFYLPITNEASNTRPNELHQRAMTARKNGFQYFGVFSDVWDDSDEAKETIKNRIEEMITLMMTDSDEITGKELQFDYIPTEIFNSSAIEKPFFWVLDDKRDIRKVMTDQSVESWLKWLDTSPNPTRVYSFGRLKI